VAPRASTPALRGLLRVRGDAPAAAGIGACYNPPAQVSVQQVNDGTFVFQGDILAVFVLTIGQGLQGVEIEINQAVNTQKTLLSAWFEGWSYGSTFDVTRVHRAAMSSRGKSSR